MLIRGGRYSVPSARQNGWDEDYDAGTDGDYFVDWLNGSDSNAGTSTGAAFKTIQKSINVVKVAASAKTVRILNTAPYYEMADFSGCYGIDSTHKHKFTGYGTQKPVIRGDTIVTGWARCSSADSAVLGAILGVDGSPVFKLRVARSSIAGDNLYSMGVTENDQMVAIAQDYASQTNPHATHTDSAMHTASSYTVDGSNNIATVTKAGVIDDYTSGQLTNAVLAFHAGANIVFFGQITAASGATVTITPQLSTYPDAAVEFGLLNILPALTAGRFGYVDVGGGNVDVYLYPTSETNLASKIGIVARVACVSMVACDNVILEGVELRHMAGAGPNAAYTVGFNLRIGSGGDPSQGVEVRHIKMACNAAGSALTTHMDYSIIEHYTVEDIYNRTGATWMAVWMSYLTTTRQWNKLLYGDYLRAEMSCIRLYGQKNTVVAYATLTDCCLGSHANLFNVYFYGENVVFWGIDSTMSGDRYGTFSSSSAVTIGMCLFNQGTTERSIDDQNNNLQEPPVLPTTHYVINNTTRGRIAIGSDTVFPEQTIVSRNNICAVVEQPSPMSTVNDSSYIALLDSGLNCGAVGAFDNQLSAASVFDGSTVALAESSPVIGLGGADLDSYLRDLEAYHGVDLHYDARGNSFVALDFHGALAAARGTADVTAPTLSSPTASAASSTSLNVGVTTAEARGGVYYVLTTSATPPSAAQIIAGQDHAGAAAVASGLLTNVTSGAKSAVPSGLTPSTLYYAYFTHEDMHGNRSAVSSASATTDAALTGIRVVAQTGKYTAFDSSHTIAVPDMLEGDLCIVDVSAVYNLQPNLNPIPTGWAQLGGAGWTGVYLPASVVATSGKGSQWLFYHIAGPGGVAGHNFVFTTASATRVTMVCHHLRGDTPLTIPAHGGAVSASVPSVSLANGDSALTIYSSFAGNAANPQLAGTTWGVTSDPTPPAGEGAWIFQYTSAGHAKQLALLKKIVATASYSPPSLGDTSFWTGYTLGLRQ